MFYNYNNIFVITNEDSHSMSVVDCIIGC